jgi:hypothetical protein
MFSREELDALHEHLSQALCELAPLLDRASPAEEAGLRSIAHHLTLAADELLALTPRSTSAPPPRHKTLA